MRGRKVVDVGCGDGYFTRLLTSLGADVVGLDVSTSMVRRAGLTAESQSLAQSLVVGDAQELPFVDGRFDFALCCGDVLDYLPRPRQALREMARVLRTGGLIMVGAGNRATLGFLWPFISLLSPKTLRYGMTPSDGLAFLFGTNADGSGAVPFPHVEFSGMVRRIPVRSTTYGELSGALAAAGIGLRLTYGVHVLTELLPYTVVSDPRATDGVRRLARALAGMDSLVEDKPPLSRLGSHLLMIGEKVPPDPKRSSPD